MIRSIAMLLPALLSSYVCAEALKIERLEKPTGLVVLTASVTFDEVQSGAKRITWRPVKPLDLELHQVALMDGSIVCMFVAQEEGDFVVDARLTDSKANTDYERRLFIHVRPKSPPGPEPEPGPAPEPDPPTPPDDVKTPFNVGPAVQRYFKPLLREQRLKAANIFEDVAKGLKDRSGAASVSEASQQIVEKMQRLNITPELRKAYGQYKTLMQTRWSEKVVVTKDEHMGAWLEIAEWLRKQ